MKSILFSLLLLVSATLFAQTNDEAKLERVMKDFHEALVEKDYNKINQYTHESLTYGHSNGWVETKKDMVADLKNGIISYDQISEDSIRTTIEGTTAHIRFIADIDATLRGVKNSFHLKVLEVWVEKNKKWVLFARQAVK
jgi:uncharacterized protein (UPF0297 family)